MAAFVPDDRTLPTRERFRLRVVEAEHCQALIDPVEEDREQLVPYFPPALGLEVERKYVLVFLRRVLRVLDRAVGAVLEPFRVLARIRGVGRALESDVARAPYPLLAGGRAPVAKVLARAAQRVFLPVAHP